jgi:hypothetical protein
VAESLILLLFGSSWSFCIIRRRLNTRPIMQKTKMRQKLSSVLTSHVRWWMRYRFGGRPLTLLPFSQFAPYYPLQMPRRHWILITESRKFRRWSAGWNRKLYQGAISFPSKSVWRSAIFVQLMVDWAALVYHCIPTKQAYGIRTRNIMYFNSSTLQHSKLELW